MGKCPHCGSEVEPHELRTSDEAFDGERESGQQTFGAFEGSDDEHDVVAEVEDKSVWVEVEVDLDSEDFEEEFADRADREKPEPGEVINPVNPADW
jgi:hypothetical protein